MVSHACHHAVSSMYLHSFPGSGFSRGPSTRVPSHTLLLRAVVSSVGANVSPLTRFDWLPTSHTGSLSATASLGPSCVHETSLAVENLVWPPSAPQPLIFPFPLDKFKSRHTGKSWTFCPAEDVFWRDLLPHVVGAAGSRTSAPPHFISSIRTSTIQSKLDLKVTAW